MSVPNIRIYTTLAADTRSMFTTVNQIEKLFEELRIGEFLVYPEEIRQTGNIFCDQVYSERNEAVLTAHSCLNRTWYFAKEFFFLPEPEDSKWVCICPQYLFARGKAENIRNPEPWQTMNCELILGLEKEINLRVDSSGKYYPYNSCNPRMQPEMAIGNWNSPLESILEKRKRIGKDTMKKILADNHLDKKGDYCSFCAKIKAEEDPPSNTGLLEIFKPTPAKLNSPILVM